MKIVGVGFKEVGKIYWFNPGPLTITKTSKVVVETVCGVELGRVIIPPIEIEDEKLERNIKDVIRIASEKDLLAYAQNEEKAKENLSTIKKIVKTFNLQMKVLGCEYTLDGMKLLIYYNADGRVDFRELVKALAGEFKVRIELRQIGPREGAKMLGAIGPCGREICCAGHLREFELVSMKMAKDQGMNLSTSKIAGVCGKLLCCICYENSLYEELREKFPAVGDIVSTPTAEACVVADVKMLQGIVKTDNEGLIEIWNINDIKKVMTFKNKE